MLCVGYSGQDVRLRNSEWRDYWRCWWVVDDGHVPIGTPSGRQRGFCKGMSTLLEGEKSLTAAQIVRVSGIIQGDGEVVDVGSNTSILGVGSNSGLTGGGFRVKSKTNVIFRNLRLSSSPAPTDLIAIQLATNIWVDHNEFYSVCRFVRSCRTINSDTTPITRILRPAKITTTRLCDCVLELVSMRVYGTLLLVAYPVSPKLPQPLEDQPHRAVGHSDSNGSEDTGKLRVTYHHNWFLNVGSRLPSLRFGTGHVYNQLMDTASESGINSRVGAQMLIEYCQFINVDKPVLTLMRADTLFCEVRHWRPNNAHELTRPFTGNDYGGATPQTNPGTLTTVPYSYVVDTSISSMAAAVKAGAGVGKVSV
ncbi:hypothetical protein FRC10_007002 [Ceratobasidium sp. 414]|nr:hypothetical protein FRC10_007002 [Ceratobasidium sp. 414]